MTSRMTSSRNHRFQKLMEPHFEALYRAARRLSATEADAEDLLQDVFVKALDHLDELAGMQYPKAWLLRVTYNRFVDQERQRQRSPQAFVDRADEKSVDGGTAAIAAGSEWEPDQVLDGHIHLMRIRKAMSLLDHKQCALVAMHDIEGMTIDELSEITGMPTGTVKSQLHRTRARLGRLLANDPAMRPRLAAVGKDSD